MTQTNETAVEVIDRMIETYRNSDIAECLAWIEPLQSARDRLAALSPSPAETDGIREAALEEAASIANHAPERLSLRKSNSGSAI